MIRAGECKQVGVYHQPHRIDLRLSDDEYLREWLCIYDRTWIGPRTRTRDTASDILLCKIFSEKKRMKSNETQECVSKVDLHKYLWSLIEDRGNRSNSAGINGMLPNDGHILAVGQIYCITNMGISLKVIDKMQLNIPSVAVISKQIYDLKYIRAARKRNLIIQKRRESLAKGGNLFCFNSLYFTRGFYSNAANSDPKENNNNKK